MSLCLLFLVPISLPYCLLQQMSSPETLSGDDFQGSLSQGCPLSSIEFPLWCRHFSHHGRHSSLSSLSSLSSGRRTSGKLEHRINCRSSYIQY